MRTISICLLLILCGCNETTGRKGRKDSSVGVWDESGQRPDFEVGRIYIAEVHGHRFAVLSHGNAGSICEVTDASLVKTNAEAK